jgi:hypothetical protein
MERDVLASLDGLDTLVLRAEHPIVAGWRLTRNATIVNARLLAVAEELVITVGVDDTFGGCKAAGLRVTHLVDGASIVIGLEEALVVLFVTSIMRAVGVIVAGGYWRRVAHVLEAALDAVAEELVVALLVSDTLDLSVAANLGWGPVRQAAVGDVEAIADAERVEVPVRCVAVAPVWGVVRFVPASLR